MIPKSLHFVSPKRPNERQQRLIEIAEKMHPGWKVHIWTDELKFADKTLESYHRKCSAEAQRADLIKLDVLWSYGGIHLDLNIRLLKSLDDLAVLKDLICCSEGGQNLSTAFFAAPPRHPAVGEVIALLTADEPDWARAPHETTGTRLFSWALRYRDDVVVLPRQSIYPERPERGPELALPTTFGILEREESPQYTSAKSRGIRRLMIECGKKLQPLVQRGVGAALPKDSRGVVHYRPANYSVGETVVSITRHSITMALPARDLSVVPSLILRGELEPAEEAFVASIIKGGDWMIDVGANVGLYGLLAASKCGPFGRVFAIEPDAELCAYMKQSISINWFHERLTVLNCAASASEGELLLQSSARERRGDQRVAHVDAVSLGEETGSPDGAVTKIKARTLDSLFPLNVPIKLMKMDIEGHEVEALRGARRLFERGCVEYLLIEVSPEIYREEFHLLIDEITNIRAMGYSLHTIKRDGTLVEETGDAALHPFLVNRNIVLRMDRRV